MAHRWPGNVRELQNAIRYAFIKCRSDTIEPEHLPPKIRDLAGRTAPVKQNRSKLSVEAYKQALDDTRGNRSKAAKVLGVSRATLYRFLAEHPELNGIS